MHCSLCYENMQVELYSRKTTFVNDDMIQLLLETKEHVHRISPLMHSFVTSEIKQEAVELCLILVQKMNLTIWILWVVLPMLQTCVVEYGKYAKSKGVLKAVGEASTKTTSKKIKRETKEEICNETGHSLCQIGYDENILKGFVILFYCSFLS